MFGYCCQSTIQTDSKILDLYDFEPFIECSQLTTVNITKEEDPLRSFILMNNKARKIGLRNKLKEDSEFSVPVFGIRRR